MDDSLVSDVTGDGVLESGGSDDDVVDIQSAAFAGHPPQFAGYIEEHGLHCQHNGYPLVVGYVRGGLHGVVGHVRGAQGKVVRVRHPTDLKTVTIFYNRVGQKKFKIKKNV